MENNMVGTWVKVSELQLGDVVDVLVNQNGTNDNAPWSSATVYQIEGEYVNLVRPYIHINDFVMSGNQVITYMGQEDIRVWTKSSTVFRLQKRQDPEEYRKAQRKQDQELKDSLLKALESGNVGYAKFLVNRMNP